MPWLAWNRVADPFTRTFRKEVALRFGMPTPEGFASVGRSVTKSALRSFERYLTVVDQDFPVVALLSWIRQRLVDAFPMATDNRSPERAASGGVTGADGRVSNQV